MHNINRKLYLQHCNKNLLKKQRIISFSSAVLLLVIMLLANMPKQWLHNWIAKHTDMPASITAPQNGPILHSIGYNCDVNNMVVVMPYEPAAIQIFLFKLPQFINTHFVLNEPFYSLNNHSVATRGPPNQYACS